MLDDDCTYRSSRDCRDGACVIEALMEQTLILRSSGTSPSERLVALKWVVHLVGDVHQPLHAGLAADKGGNGVQLRAFGKGSNLHALWDSGLIDHRLDGMTAHSGLTDHLCRC
ncbi:S1/P1 nuclease [Roseateles sp. DXS20W]|uniref:S1/P1 nuclease n=1 Tax=Pelomonas lactea TaxID=3299030 RepID=A0ABW7GQB9_9BURK